MSKPEEILKALEHAKLKAALAELGFSQAEVKPSDDSIIFSNERGDELGIL